MTKRTRLRWLDSTRAQDDEPAEPYTPIAVSLHANRSVASLSILGRSLTVASANCGLPTSIVSWGAELLSAPLRLNLAGHEGWKPVSSVLGFTKTSTGIVSWQVECVTVDRRFSLVTTCTLEAEGSLDVKLSVSQSDKGATWTSRVSEADQTAVLSNATFAIDFTNTNRTSRYSMGFGFLGAELMHPQHWQWNDLLPKRNSMLWVGGGSGGMRVSLKGPESHWGLPMWYGWPSARSGYDPTLAEVPRSWGGDKKDGGCLLSNASDPSAAAVPLRCWSNTLTFSGRQSIDFHLDLLITPFRDLNSMARSHFGIRHYQLGYPNSNDANPPASIKENYGSTVIGLHQGTSVNPFISWIFDPDTSQNMSRYIASAHAQGMRVKAYFTVRELSVRSALSELFGVISLGDEILERRLSFPDPWEHRDNLGNAWLQSHALLTWLS